MRLRSVTQTVVSELVNQTALSDVNRSASGECGQAQQLVARRGRRRSRAPRPRPGRRGPPCSSALRERRHARRADGLAAALQLVGEAAALVGVARARPRRAARRSAAASPRTNSVHELARPCCGSRRGSCARAPRRPAARLVAARGRASVGATRTQRSSTASRSCGAQRLGEVVVHARRAGSARGRPSIACAVIAMIGTRRPPDSPARIRGGRLVAVDVGHLAVHEHREVRRGRA